MVNVSKSHTSWIYNLLEQLSKDFKRPRVSRLKTASAINLETVDRAQGSHATVLLGCLNSPGAHPWSLTASSGCYQQGHRSGALRAWSRGQQLWDLLGSHYKCGLSHTSSPPLSQTCSESGPSSGYPPHFLGDSDVPSGLRNTGWSRKYGTSTSWGI